jgi:hypothetical protein
MDERDSGITFTPSLSLHECIVAVVAAHRASALEVPVECLDESSLAERLVVAALNVFVTDTEGDGLLGQMDGETLTMSWKRTIKRC